MRQPTKHVKSIFKKINVHYVLAVLLFLLSLYFLSVREAHVLCARLLLHLRGETFVQGNPPGCVIYTIPNVQFTENHKQALRSRSKNSLDDFVLASATGNYFKLESPPASASWSGHPLLEWAAFRLAWVSRQQYADLNPTNLPPTNVVALATLNNAHQAIQLAQTANPTNGALWLAEASVCFTEKQDQVALAALQTAATNRNWSANSATAFSYITDLLEKAGLSELDAAMEAKEQTPDLSLLSIQGNCMRSFHEQLVAAVTAKDEQQFSTLLRLLVELRRAERSDWGEYSMNSFRRFQGYDELINPMAKQLGQNPLPESETVPYEQIRKMRDQIFQDYINKYADQKTVASFLTQSEDYRTEKKLRMENRGSRSQSVMWSWLRSTVAGFLSLLALSLLAISLLFEIVLWSLRKYADQPSKLPRRKEFWIVASLVLIASTAVFANFWITSGIDSKVGLSLAEPPPLISPNLQGVLIALLLCCAWLTLLLLDWKGSKAPLKPWLLTLFFAFAYLASVVAMAYFRSETVEKIATAWL